MIALSTPRQPSDKATLSGTQQQIGKKIRYFNPSWYQDFSWIHFCVTRNKIFCWCCVKAYTNGLLTGTKKYDNAFILDGFSNWKKARERLERHQVSECHSEAQLKLSMLRGPSVIQQLSSQATETQSQNRSMLLKLLSSLKFLLRQGMAIRGHKEVDGNLIQLLKLRSSDAPGLKRWLDNRQYLSHDIVNEMITLMGNTLLRKLLTRIREAQWFSIIADETRDISNHEQLSICIRWVNSAYEVQEDLIGMVHVLSTTSATLTSAIKDVLIRCILPLNNCRGQAYDGAANMMGHLRGVATQLQSEQPLALKVHCFAHCLNLCLQDASRKSSPVRNALDIVMELSQLILYSPKRSLVFQHCKQDLSPGGSGLRPLCPTRWTVRTGSIDAVLRNYAAVLQALQEISEESHDDYGRRANGVMAQLQRFDTYFGLKLSYLIFSGTEQTSTSLQRVDTSVQDALSGAEIAVSYLKRLRNDESYKLFYASTVQQAVEHTGEPTLPRYRRPPKRLDNGVAPHSFNSPEDYYRSHYFYALDLVSEEITDRFNQSSMFVPKELEKLLIDAANLDGNSHIEIQEVSSCLSQACI